MELHNTAEGIVLQTVEEIYNSLEKGGNPEGICTCSQCRLDTACYVLNRTTPYYVVSNRGVERDQQANVDKQQKVADIAALVHEGIKRISHNQRPDISHSASVYADAQPGKPVFNIPTITGRLFNGDNFAPISNAKIELYKDNELVKMKDEKWKNPYQMVPHTDGSYSFWPVPIYTDKADEPTAFQYTLKIECADLETLTYVFKIHAKSEFQTANAISLARTFRLPDLYMFAPGEEMDIDPPPKEWTGRSPS